jgi:Uma2 family endonuclease
MTTSLLDPAQIVLLGRRHRVTLAEYHRMAEAGVFGPEPRVELLEGVIVEKMTKNPPHVIATDLIDNLLHRLVPADYFVSMGNPVAIAERDSEPEPDAAVVRGTPRDYIGRRRTARDAALVVEVADSSYDVDSRVKAAVYAAAGVPVYWLLDLNRRRLEIHADPTPAGYARLDVADADGAAPLVLDGAEVARFAVGEVLP